MATQILDALKTSQRIDAAYRNYLRSTFEPARTDIGREFEAAIDAAELTKGKAAEIKPKYWSPQNGATAATTMRLAEPWFGTGRVVAGDSRTAIPGCPHRSS